MMKFYNQPHEFYCGIDLHANSMHVCIVDHQGKKHLHRNFDTKKCAGFLKALQPFAKSDLIIGCESTFNWYWLADLCHQRNLAFLLGHALYLKAIHGGKTKSDRIDCGCHTLRNSTAISTWKRAQHASRLAVCDRAMESTRFEWKRRRDTNTNLTLHIHNGAYETNQASCTAL